VTHPDALNPGLFLFFFWFHFVETEQALKEMQILEQILLDLNSKSTIMKLKTQSGG
jgi:hypothetical protein